MVLASQAQLFMNTVKEILTGLQVMVGVIFIVFGFILKKRPPKSVNHLYGYRTPKSMKNETNWAFSQLYAANEMLQLGFILIPVGVVMAYLSIESEFMEAMTSIAMLILLVIRLFIRTERAIERNEVSNDENG